MSALCYPFIVVFSNDIPKHPRPREECKWGRCKLYRHRLFAMIGWIIEDPHDDSLAVCKYCARKVGIDAYPYGSSNVGGFFEEAIRSFLRGQVRCLDFHPVIQGLQFLCKGAT